MLRWKSPRILPAGIYLFDPEPAAMTYGLDFVELWLPNLGFFGGPVPAVAIVLAFLLVSDESCFSGDGTSLF